jgi:hypothetical protein
MSRGLARSVETYREALRGADRPEPGPSTDGVRGPGDAGRGLSRTGLEAFCTYFLRTSLEQVRFMERILKPSELAVAVGHYAEREVMAKRLMNGSAELLVAAVKAGEVKRGDVAQVTGYAERWSREIMVSLLDKGLLRSDSPRGALRLGFPIEVLGPWFPELYPAVAAREAQPDAGRLGGDS